MILQALTEYYDRKASDPDSEIAPPGWEWKEIPFVIVLDLHGSPINISSTYEGEGRNRRAKRFLVTQSVKKTSGIASNLLWENPEYALGVASESKLKGKSDKDRIKLTVRAKEQHQAFIDLVNTLGDIDDAGLAALRSFLSIATKEELLKGFQSWDEIKDSGATVSFGLTGESGLILERPSIKRAIESRSQMESSASSGICLITGRAEKIERLHPSIKGVRGAQTSGANIVSFNLTAFTSFGKEQGANAPIGQSSVFAYTTAINHLLGKDSQQKLSIGDTTMVFWSERKSDLEEGLLDIFGEPPKDDPDRGVKAVESLFRSVEIGSYVEDERKDRFFVLGLAPNASRISIRFWIIDTVPGMATKLQSHFEDLGIIHSVREKEILSLFRLLCSVSAQTKAENIPPNLAGETMRSILEGLPYPTTLFQAAVRRNRAEQAVTYPRASLIKACINRSTRFKNPNIKEELKVSLDQSNTNVGYRLGRLFATLEKVQAEANPGINATIRDRYYGAASGTPVSVFSNLMRLKNHHLAKLENKGRRIYFEKLIAEIVDTVQDFPSHLSLPDQGRFAIGYYHQNQSFYTKKEVAAGDSDEMNKGEENNE